MLYLRAFMSGITIPTIVLPVLWCLAIFMRKSELLSITFLHYIPVLWGVWNVLYFASFRNIFKGPELIKVMITGAILGLIVAFIGIFILNVPSIMGLTGDAQLYPLLGGPILYAILWAFGVRFLNRVVGISPL